MTTTKVMKTQETKVTKNTKTQAQDNTPKCAYNSESGKFTFTVPTIELTENGYSTKNTFKKFSKPHNIREEHAPQFAKMIEASVLLQKRVQAQNTVNKLTAKIDNGEVLTYVEEKTKSNAKLIVEHCNLLMNKLAIATYTDTKFNNEMKHLIVCYLTGQPLNIETAQFRKSMIELSNHMTEALVKYANGETITISKEEQELLTYCKAKLKELLKPYCTDTTYTKAFKLSVSNRDIIDLHYWMQSNALTGGENKLSNSKSKALESALVKYFLKKVKLVEE